MPRVKEAKKKAQKFVLRRAKPVRRLILMDTDQLGSDSERQQVDAEARKAHFDVIWQDPCHEGFLLRHFDGYANAKPPNSKKAEKALKTVWPEYKKGMLAKQLHDRLTRGDLIQAAQQDESLKKLLTFVGLL